MTPADVVILPTWPWNPDAIGDRIHMPDRDEAEQIARRSPNADHYRVEACGCGEDQ